VLLGHSLEFHCRPKSHDQSPLQEPSRRTSNSALLTDHLSLGNESFSTAVVKRSMQCRQINSSATCMKVDHGWILESFTINEVCFEEFFMDLRKSARVSLVKSPSHPDAAARVAFPRSLAWVIDSRSADDQRTFDGFARARTAM
jgi:hypothetical protein